MRYSGIGGQAVMEGVMMKGPKERAVAVRKPDGSIEVKKEPNHSLKDKYKIARVPIIRGVVTFVESLVGGMGDLNYSASFWEEEDEKEKENTTEKKSDGLIMGLIVVLAFIFAIGLFVLLPFFVSELLAKVIPSLQLRGLIEGVIRVVLFVSYVKLIAFMEDIRRVFMYHGAEHKCINCIETGNELTVENVRKQSMQHKRCGTSFLLTVMFISILFFMFIVVQNMWLRMALRVVLIPVIAGLSYEFILLAGKSENAVIGVLSKPGMWLQALTTREPEDDMIEVAIRSVEAVFDWKSFLAEEDATAKKEETSVQEEEVVEERKEDMVEEEPEVAKESEEEVAAVFEVLDIGDEEGEEDELLREYLDE